MAVIKKIDPREASHLIDELDEYLQGLYPAESNHLDSIDELRKKHVIMFGVFDGSEIHGIGAVKIMQGYGEIKRMYVPPKHRGKKLSIMIMEKLESYLAHSGIRWARLETGISQQEAIGLYRRLGYTECEPFGDYVLDPLSMFMEKKLSSKDDRAVL